MSRARVLSWFAIAAIALLLALAFTAPYGTLNQATYLLDPLRRALPELYRHDWFMGTPPYLPVFGWVAEGLYRIDPEGPAAVLAAHVVVTLATYAGLRARVATIDEDVRTFAIVAGMLAVTMGRAMGGNYVLAGYLQPSALATVGWLFAMALLARRRYLACGIALALGGLFHANFLVLGIGLFTLTALIGREARLRDHALLLAPQLVVLAAFLPQLVAAAGPGADAVRILVEFHAPGHYAGARLVQGIPELVAWQLAALAALRLTAEPTREMRVLWRFGLASLAVCVATAVLVLVPAFASLTQVRWSRIAPFGQLACQVVVAGALIRHALAPVALSRLRRGLVVLALLAAVVLTARSLHASLAATLIAAAGTALVLAPRLPAARPLTTALAALAVIGALWASPRGRGLTLEPEGGEVEHSLEAWARAKTPVDAVFLVPPYLQRFRLLARRAIVADTKSPPLAPDLLVAWYARLCALVEAATAKTHEQVEAAYEHLDAQALERVAHHFHADYIVANRALQLPGERVFENAEYAVYATTR